MHATEKARSDAWVPAKDVHDKTIPDVKATWIDEYVKLHAALREKLPRDPARVKAFFYLFKKDRNKPADGTGDAPAPSRSRPVPPPRTAAVFLRSAW